MASFLSFQSNQARHCQNVNDAINMLLAVTLLMPRYHNVNPMEALSRCSVICHTVTVLTRMETNGPTLVLMSDMEGPFVMTQVVRFRTIIRRSARIMCLEKT